MRNWTFSRPSIPMILRAFTCPGSCANPSNKLFKSRLLTGEISKRHRPLSKSEVGCQRGTNLNVQAKHQFGYRAWIRTMNNASKGRMFEFISNCLSANYKIDIFCCCICCCYRAAFSFNSASSSTRKWFREKGLSPRRASRQSLVPCLLSKAISA